MHTKFCTEYQDNFLENETVKKLIPSPNGIYRLEADDESIAVLHANTGVGFL